jgi:hypothetical protein
MKTSLVLLTVFIVGCCRFLGLGQSTMLPKHPYPMGKAVDPSWTIARECRSDQCDGEIVGSGISV